MTEKSKEETCSSSLVDLGNGGGGDDDDIALEREQSALRQRRTAASTPSDGGNGVWDVEKPDADPHGDFGKEASASADAGEEGDRNEEEEDFEEEKLPLSTFSLMFIAELNSRAYLYALLVYIVQLTVVVAALLDNFDLEKTSNPANFPPGVDIPVTVAQGLMIPLSVAAQNDFVIAVVRLNDRTAELAYKANSEDPSCTQRDDVSSEKKEEGMKRRSRKLSLLDSGPTNKWLFCCLARLLVGCGILIVSFLLMMKSETVFKVLINFVALIMISNISTIAYTMAANGFLGYKVWKDTVKVSNHVVKRKYKSDTFKQIVYLLVVAAMYSGFAVVYYRQRTGQYQCNSVLVQFDDEFDTSLPLLSGIYDITNGRSVNRFVFSDDLGLFSMAYCGPRTAWTVSRSGIDDPCALYAASQESFDFDIIGTAASPWRANSQRDNSLVDTKSFEMQCATCTNRWCEPHRGTCIDNKCVCNEGRYGIHCEFRSPCEEITLNERLGAFPPIVSIVNRDYVIPASSYKLLRDDNGTRLEAYHRPVYVSEDIDFVVLFQGQRWIIINPRIAYDSRDGSNEPLSNEVMRRGLVAILRNQHLFDVFSDRAIQVFTASEAVEFGSPLDTGSPIGLNWLGVRRLATNSSGTSIDRFVHYDATFLCRFCDPLGNDCDNLSTCNPETRLCDCRTDTILGFAIHRGAQCEDTLSCIDVQRMPESALPSGCIGSEYTCNPDGRCSCEEQFPDAGRFCQFLPCYSQAIRDLGGCQNGGTCSNITGLCQCEADFFQGRYCEKTVPGCHEADAVLMFSPNGCDVGFCNNVTGFCDCPIGRKGRYCQHVQSLCTDSIVREIYPPDGCAYDATCNVTTGVCDCPNPIFEGVSCEVLNRGCGDPDVQEIFPNCTGGRGVCNMTTGFCNCNSASFDGRYCQLEVMNFTL